MPATRRGLLFCLLCVPPQAAADADGTLVLDLRCPPAAATAGLAGDLLGDAVGDSVGDADDLLWCLRAAAGSHNGHRRSPLHLAAMAGDAEAVRWLLSVRTRVRQI